MPRGPKTNIGATYSTKPAEEQDSQRVPKKDDIGMRRMPVGRDRLKETCWTRLSYNEEDADISRKTNKPTLPAVSIQRPIPGDNSELKENMTKFKAWGIMRTSDALQTCIEAEEPLVSRHHQAVRGLNSGLN